MIFIVSVLVTYRQIRYVQTTNLGYDRSHVVTFSSDRELRSHFRPFVNDLQRVPGVTGVASADANMTGVR